MLIRSLDENHDWIFGTGKNSYSSNLNAVVVDLETRILSFYGDCYFSTNSGIDYINLLGVGTKSLLDQEVKRVILNTQDVLSITKFVSEINSEREYTVNATITTVYGTTTIGVQV